MKKNKKKNWIVILNKGMIANPLAFAERNGIRCETIVSPRKEIKYLFIMIDQQDVTALKLSMSGAIIRKAK